MTKNSDCATTVTVSLPADVYLAVAEEAEDTGRTIGDVVRDALTEVCFDRRGDWHAVARDMSRLMEDGHTNARVVAEVNKAIKGGSYGGTLSRVTIPTVTFYRNKLRRSGLAVPTDAEARLDAVTR